MSTDKNNKLRITNVKTNINLDITSREKKQDEEQREKVNRGKKLIVFDELWSKCITKGHGTIM